MRHQILAAALAFLVPSASFAAAWEFDSQHSTIGFSVRHLVVSNVKGQFDAFTGTMNWDEKDVTKSTVEVDVDTRTVNTGNASRDGHLRSEDFFSAEKFPHMTFKSKKVEKAGEGKLKVTGDLTIRGVTKETVLEVEGPMKPVKGPAGNDISGVSATGKINRKDFGLAWGKVIEGTGAVVGDEVKLMLEVELDRKEPAKAEAKKADPKVEKVEAGKKK